MRRCRCLWMQTRHMTLQGPPRPRPIPFMNFSKNMTKCPRKLLTSQVWIQPSFQDVIARMQCSQHASLSHMSISRILIGQSWITVHWRQNIFYKHHSWSIRYNLRFMEPQVILKNCHVSGAQLPLTFNQAVCTLYDYERTAHQAVKYLPSCFIYFFINSRLQ